MRSGIAYSEIRIVKSRQANDVDGELKWTDQCDRQKGKLLDLFASRDQTESREAAQRVQEETVRLEAESKRKVAEQALSEAESKRKARVEAESQKLAEQKTYRMV